MEHEVKNLVRAVIMSILDDDSSPSWSPESTAYYEKLADHAMYEKEEFVDAIKEVATKIRRTYRSYEEYSELVERIPLTKDGPTCAEDRPVSRTGLCRGPACVEDRAVPRTL